MRKLLFAVLCLVIISGAALASKPTLPEYTIAIKNHVFSPSELVLPEGKRVKLVIDNQDKTAEEFESHDLRREKIIPGNSKGIIMVGPLKKGEYKFFGEFNMDTANGVIKVQ